MRSSLALTLLTSTVLLTTNASAQRLLGLDAGFGGGGAAGSVRINLIDANTCNVPTFCQPIPPGGPITTTMPPYGGIAYGRLSNTTWFTPGPTLHHVDPSCGHIDYYRVPGAGAVDGWTGLAIEESLGKLFFTTTNRVAEVDVPPSAGGAGPFPFPAATLATLVGVGAPWPLAVPLTGVEYDDSDDTLWVIDSQYNVVHMDRPSAGGTVLSFFNVAGFCGGTLTPWMEGITLAPNKQVPGFAKGVIYLSDSSNRLLLVDYVGNPIRCCALAPLANPLIGLTRTRLLPRHIGRGCSHGCIDPSLRDLGDPILGSHDFKLQLQNAPAPSAAALFLSLSTLPIAFDCGRIEVNLLDGFSLGPRSVLGSGPCDGRATWDFPLPNDPVFANLTFYAQAAGVDASTAFFLSDALELTIQ